MTAVGKAQRALTPEMIARGVQVADAEWGYRYVAEPAESPAPGLCQPPDMHYPTIKELRDHFKIRAHDVAIATYPKCGTTWMQQIVLLLCRGADAPVSPMQDAPWLEMSACAAYRNAPSSTKAMSVSELCSTPVPAPPFGRNVWKTHAPSSAPPWVGGVAGAKDGKVIVVSRNSKDAAISMFHHARNIPSFAFTGEWEHFAPIFLDGTVEYSSYWHWHQGWWNAAKGCEDFVLWVTFEDLKRDLAGEIARVSAFLGLPPRSPEEMAAIVARCDFAAMKKEADVRDSQALKEGRRIKKGHFRQGKVGGFRAVMSDETRAKFDAMDEAELEPELKERIAMA